MPEEVKKEQTKAAEQENITELSDAQLDEAVGGLAIDAASEPSRFHPDLKGSKGYEGELDPREIKAFEDLYGSLGLG